MYLTSEAVLIVTAEDASFTVLEKEPSQKVYL